ncbi:hypothetical protein HK097_001906 [Rhizophlyctis rosea]|uniref:F-box domain-containing protein n=1 Tax=Rhizophlyctis rosea TaxID=64517 RepID=A0AAD5X1K5_9FUNG|nr:hypothetical protein HK097_001906 [Rhizophlyctis rosea]
MAATATPLNTLPTELLPLLLTFTTISDAIHLRLTCRRMYRSISDDDLAYPYAKQFVSNRPKDWGAWKLEYTIKQLTERGLPKPMICKVLQIVMDWKLQNAKQWTSWSIEDFLVTAIKHFEISTVEFALKYKPDIHHDHSLPICVASQRGSLPILTLLLHHSANPNANSHLKSPHPFKHSNYETVTTPLIRACTFSQLPAMRYLIEKGADISVDDYAVAKVAVRRDSPEMLQLLIDNGLDPTYDSNRLLHTAIIHTHTKVVNYLLRTCGVNPNDRDGAFLYQACVKGSFEIVQALLDCGADVNKPYRGGVPIMVAWNLDVVQLLVDFGADVNKGLEHACRLDLVGVAEFLVGRGADPGVLESAVVRVAAKKGDAEFLGRLIWKGGVDVHACEDEAIKNASVLGHAECVNVLLQNSTFDTDVLSWAAYGAGMGGHLPILKILNNNGADVHFSDEMLLREAVTAGYVMIVEYLLQCGGDPHRRAKHVDSEKAWTALEHAVLRGEVVMLRTVVGVGKCWENVDAFEKACRLAETLGASLQLMNVLDEARNQIPCT